jgi:hypothetical protein
MPQVDFSQSESPASEGGLGGARVATVRHRRSRPSRQALLLSRRLRHHYHSQAWRGSPWQWHSRSPAWKGTRHGRETCTHFPMPTTRQAPRAALAPDMSSGRRQWCDHTQRDSPTRRPTHTPDRSQGRPPPAPAPLRQCRPPRRPSPCTAAAPPTNTSQPGLPRRSPTPEIDRGSPESCPTSTDRPVGTPSGSSTSTLLHTPARFWPPGKPQAPFPCAGSQ